ncbi:MAG: dTDP-4-keto-6-deoxy-D-glucose epimerase [Bacteriovoracaceae bacterium]|jgi:dTDP-4-dehydrorhamnose 3,5-epimerase|nr:dTDP-4-keto-6-deoxy-D-glucose epimerase [Bacteriovoracaceae bacterium]
MKVEIIDELKKITPEPYIDERGIYLEIFNKKEFATVSPVNFIQDDFSRSKKGVFRGLHGDQETWKLVSCSYGEIILLVLNCDIESASFGKSYSFQLNADRYCQILIPPMFANGHFVMSEQAIFNYKQSTYYEQYKQFSININSALLNDHTQSIKPLTLSKRDQDSNSIDNPANLKLYIQNCI